MVSVVDGSRFLMELDSLESLRQRDWQADPEDERTIAHLLCDQVEFGELILICVFFEHQYILLIYYFLYLPYKSKRYCSQQM